MAILSQFAGEKRAAAFAFWGDEVNMPCCCAICRRAIVPAVRHISPCRNLLASNRTNDGDASIIGRFLIIYGYMAW
jgi:hypothetical protein